MKPLVTTCTKTSSSITIFWSNSLTGLVTGYQVHFKKSSDNSYGSWITVGNVTSYLTTGLLSNTSYDFQVRGTCASGNTGASTKFTCSTNARLGNEVEESSAAISTYPNPSTGSFNVAMNGFELGTVVTIKVINTLGQIVYSAEKVSTDADALIALDNVTTGVYSVEVNDGTHRFVESIILNK
ncbi:MAG: fibronectin type III domain-containing protein [Chitinophagales bacterium]|nr:fibronectin type III domain-containing protein [Chitinophagales bacterium]